MGPAAMIVFFNGSEGRRHPLLDATPTSDNFSCRGAIGAMSPHFCSVSLTLSLSHFPNSKPQFVRRPATIRSGRSSFSCVASKFWHGSISSVMTIL
ncbi:hypothetical protein SDJN03_03572, partial [Cucurbita argyrosperma subsp. sororia]